MKGPMFRTKINNKAAQSVVLSHACFWPCRGGYGTVPYACVGFVVQAVTTGLIKSQSCQGA